MIRKIAVSIILSGIVFISSCAKHELSEERVSDEKALEMTNAVFTAVRNSFYDGIANIKPGETGYDGIDYVMFISAENSYRINFDDYAIIVNGKVIVIKDGEAEFFLKDRLLFTGIFEIGKLEFLYDKFERDFEWNFTYDGTNYEGELEIEDNKYSCAGKCFQKH